jgi:glucose-1-phosphate thymidylyltransferase
MKQNKLHVEKLGRGVAWFDTGTHDSLLETASFIQTIEKRQGLLVGSPDEIAYENGWIRRDALKKLAEQFIKTEYGKTLIKLANKEI